MPKYNHIDINYLPGVQYNSGDQYYNYTDTVSNNIQNYLFETYKDQVGEAVDNNKLHYIQKYINVNNPYKFVSNILVNFELGKLNFIISILPEVLGYYLLNPAKDDHSWSHIRHFANTNGGFELYDRYQCSKCGLKKIIKEGWHMSEFNLSCDEMMIKDIIE